MKLAQRCLVFGLLLMLSSCGDGFAGTYQDARGLTKYEFHDDGGVHISVLGTRVSAEYRLDGDKVLLTSPQGTVVLSREGERLLGPMGLELIRQPDS